MPCIGSRTGLADPISHSHCGSPSSLINMSISGKSLQSGVVTSQTSKPFMPLTTSNSLLTRSNPRDLLPLNLPGQQLLAATPRQSSSPIHIDPGNLQTTRAECKKFLGSEEVRVLDQSLELTKYSEPCLPGTTDSPSTTLNRRPPSSTACWDKGNLTKVVCPQGDLTKLIGTSAGDTISESCTKIVRSDMCASSAKETIVKPSVHVVKTGRERMHEQWKMVVRNPKYH